MRMAVVAVNTDFELEYSYNLPSQFIKAGNPGVL